MFPAIVDEQERLSYKREFERDHQEYKSLQAELDTINQNLADLDKELNRHPEGSPQFLVSIAVPTVSDKYHCSLSLKYMVVNIKFVFIEMTKT